jgi:hypothetical protein
MMNVKPEGSVPTPGRRLDVIAVVEVAGVGKTAAIGGAVGTRIGGNKLASIPDAGEMVDLPRVGGPGSWTSDSCLISPSVVRAVIKGAVSACTLLRLVSSNSESAASIWT